MHEILGFQLWGVISFVALILTLIMGFVLAKIALRPLRDHFEQLEQLSKETLHELNLPINTITANVEMLRKSIQDEKGSKRLDRIAQASNMLKERYNDLDYMIKKQMSQEEVSTVNLQILIEERLLFLRPLYPNVRFDVELLPLYVRLDPKGFAKVIDNLIENGIKYSPENPHIYLQIRGNIVEIIDHGMGMDEITLIHVFDRYYQNDSSVQGFGIGLTLVKRYCDRYGIRLQIESKQGEGTRIILEFKQREK